MPKTNFENQIDFKGQKFYVGLDVHKKSWSVTIRSLNIEIAKFTQSPGAEGLHSYLQNHYPGGEYFSAYEAGFCGTSAHEQLCKLGINNIVIHAADIPLTDKEKKNKTDKRDSRTIAERLSLGDLKGIHIMSREQQELRSLFRLRESKVSDVTMSNNRLKGFLMFFSIEVPESICSTPRLSAKALKWLSNLELASAAGTITLRQYIDELKYQRKQLYTVTKKLREQIQAISKREYECLMSVPGIGSITAMGLITEIGDFDRFKTPDQYTSFLGLCPWESSSGNHIKTKGMQPRCNRHLRHLLVEAAWMSVKKSPAIFSYYSKHAPHNTKRAIIKVARKIALIARGVAMKQQLFSEDFLKTEQKTRSLKKRFSLGISQKHINEQPGNTHLVLPG